MLQWQIVSRVNFKAESSAEGKDEGLSARQSGVMGGDPVWWYTGPAFLTAVL